ncbi:DUF805 domain-containing protein [Novosphingobium sp. YAF33]|uniref:DUF805 domain-containing protein n=1 Tax=Novosphingobium sp. YAF33 TaxID=3233082 RepID=UPI003F9A9D8A
MIGYHLVRLAKFSGRETRAAFWPWAAVVVGLVLLGGVAAMTPQVLASMAKMRKFALEHPDQATITSGPGHYEISIEGHHPELMPDMGPFVLALEGTMAVLIVLIAAAAVRRLHDRGVRAPGRCCPCRSCFSASPGCPCSLPIRCSTPACSDCCSSTISAILQPLAR